MYYKHKWASFDLTRDYKTETSSEKNWSAYKQGLKRMGWNYKFRNL